MRANDGSSRDEERVTEGPKAAAGWYPNPEEPGTERYWNGDRWTDAVREPDGAPEPSVPRRLPSVPTLLATLGLVVGSIGPWVDAGFVSAGGLEGDGAITMGCAIVIGICAVLDRGAPLAVIAGVIAALVAGYDIINIESQDGLRGAVASPGWGVILALVSALAAVASAIVDSRRQTAIELAERPTQAPRQQLATQPVQSQPVVSEAVPTSRPATERRSHRRLVLMLVAVLALGAGVVGGYFVLAGDGEEDQPASSSDPAGRSNIGIVSDCLDETNQTIGAVNSDPDFLACLEDEGADQATIDAWSD
jgi:hypothetical protein